MSEMIFELEEKKNSLLRGVQDLMELANTLAKVCLYNKCYLKFILEFFFLIFFIKMLFLKFKLNTLY